MPVPAIIAAAAVPPPVKSKSRLLSDISSSNRKRHLANLPLLFGGAPLESLDQTGPLTERGNSASEWSV